MSWYYFWVFYTSISWITNFFSKIFLCIRKVIESNPQCMQLLPMHISREWSQVANCKLSLLNSNAFLQFNTGFQDYVQNLRSQINITLSFPNCRGKIEKATSSWSNLIIYYLSIITLQGLFQADRTQIQFVNSLRLCIFDSWFSHLILIHKIYLHS